MRREQRQSDNAEVKLDAEVIEMANCEKYCTVRATHAAEILDCTEPCDRLVTCTGCVLQLSPSVSWGLSPVTLEDGWMFARTRL